MSNNEKEKTDQKKVKGSEEGKQSVENSETAKECRKEASDKAREEIDSVEENKQMPAERREKGSLGASSVTDTRHENEMANKSAEELEQEKLIEALGGEDVEEPDAAEKEDSDDGDFEDPGSAPAAEDEEYKVMHIDEGDDALQDTVSEEGESEIDQEKVATANDGNNGKLSAGNKREIDLSQDRENKPKRVKISERASNISEQGQKEQNEEKESEERPGSPTRLPKQGQKCRWKSVPGYIEGKVVEVIRREKTVGGKKYRASETDPRIVLKSQSSGKVTVHRPEVCLFA